MKKLFLFALLFPVVALLGQRAGDIDATFGVNGCFVASFPSGYNRAMAVAIQADGKIVSAGYTDNIGSQFAFARCLTNGSPDPEFGTDGKVSLNISEYLNKITALLIQPDGKIIGVGYASSISSSVYDIVLIRLLADGSPDPDFGTNGMISYGEDAISEKAYAAALQSDGKIVVAATHGTNESFAMNVVRFNTDGTPDSFFGINGTSNHSFGGLFEKACDVAIQPDGKIIIAGYSDTYQTNSIVLGRLLPDGTIDNTFGYGGFIVNNPCSSNDMATSVALQDDGKILVGGTSGEGTNNTFMLLRFNTDATPDGGFGNSGTVTSSYTGSSNAIAIQADDKIVLGGTTGYIYALERYNNDGTPDTTFGINGRTEGPGDPYSGIESIALQEDEKIVAAGNGGGDWEDSFMVTRYMGSPFTSAHKTEAGSKLLMYPNPATGNVTIRIPDAGQYTCRLTMYNATGELILSTQFSEEKLTLNCNYLPSGLYIIKINSEGHEFKDKLMVR